MLKALFKKQFMELGSYYFRSKRKNKKRGAAGIAGMILIFLLLFISLGSMFFMIATQICEPLLLMDLGWLFFTLMGIIALVLGVFGSVFSTFAGLYHAKDNETLLAMPIPPSKLLLVRLATVYITGLVFEMIVMIPALIAYWVTVPKVGIGQIVMQLLLVLLLGLVILVLTCILGWLVALISARLKNKSFVTVALTLVFIAAYYFVYFRINTMLMNMLANAENVAAGIRGAVYPLYAFGRGGEGDAVSFLIFAAIALVLFVVCLYVLSRTFIRIVTTNRGEKKKVYTKQQQLKSGSVRSTLLMRELRRFKASPAYMLNAGFGLLMLPLLGIFALIKMGTVRGVIDGLGATMPGAVPFLPLAALAAVGFLSSMNTMTAPSVSLEGKTLWAIQSLPVDAWDVLKAKLQMHVGLSLLPLLFATVVLCFVIRASLPQAVCIILVALLFLVFSAVFGLALNLKKPSLDWTNETVAVKQSPAVMISIFGLWALALAMAALYYPLRNVMRPEPYMLIWIVILALADWLLLRWLKTRGSRIFAEL